jgi:hypothetical protein
MSREEKASLARRDSLGMRVPSDSVKSLRRESLSRLVTSRTEMVRDFGGVTLAFELACFFARWKPKASAASVRKLAVP